MSRDCSDPVVSKELVIISVELVEKAEVLEAHFSMSPTSDDSHSAEIVTSGGDNDDDAA